MAICPFARFDKIGNWGAGRYTGPETWKIIHHKTQGSSYPRSTYLNGGGIPHFTVGRYDIWQHFDTDVASRALTNLAGGVETNNSWAIQIEAIGYSGIEDIEVAKNVAHLCRWIESVHGVKNVWPAGRPACALYDEHGTPRSPGTTPCDTWTWLTESGHYSHSQVPENRDGHWDPAYTDNEFHTVWRLDVLEPEDIEKIAQRTCELVWAHQIPLIEDDLQTTKQHAASSALSWTHQEGKIMRIRGIKVIP